MTGRARVSLVRMLGILRASISLMGLTDLGWVLILTPIARLDGVIALCPGIQPTALAQLFLNQLEVSIGELLKLLLQVYLAVLVFARWVMQDDCKLPFVTYATSSPEKLSVLQEGLWQHANNQKVTTAKFNLGGRKKVEPPPLGFVDNEHGIPGCLLLGKYRNSTV